MNRRAPLFVGIAVGVVALLLVVFLVLPKMGQVGTAKDDLQQAQDQEITLQAQLRALQDAQASAPQTEAEIKALQEQVPTTPDLPGLFRLLQSAADRSAVDFFQFSPALPVVDASGTFSTIGSQILVTGSYFSLQDFLYNMESLPRAAKVTSIAITPQASSSGETTTTITPGNRLQLQMSVDFYTTDTTGGAGAGAGEAAPTATPTPTPTPTPSGG